MMHCTDYPPTWGHSRRINRSGEMTRFAEWIHACTRESEVERAKETSTDRPFAHSVVALDSSRAQRQMKFMKIHKGCQRQRPKQFPRENIEARPYEIFTFRKIIFNGKAASPCDFHQEIIITLVSL